MNAALITQDAGVEVVEAGNADEAIAIPDLMPKLFCRFPTAYLLFLFRMSDRAHALGRPSVKMDRYKECSADRRNQAYVNDQRKPWVMRAPICGSPPPFTHDVLQSIIVFIQAVH